MALAENLKAWREKKGWTTYELGDIADVPQSNISRMEQGKTRPRPATLSRLANALGTSTQQLEFGSNEIEFVPIGKRKVPVLDYVQAGKWTGVNDSPSDYDAVDYIFTDASVSADAFAMVIRGESMLPEFRPGDMGIFDPHLKPRPGDYVIAVDGHGEATFKRYKVLGVSKDGEEVFELRPLNEFFPTLRSDEMQVRVVATLKEATRRYRRD